MDKELMHKAVLCFVDECWAYFTTQELKEAQGRHWENSPVDEDDPAQPPEDPEDESFFITCAAWEGPFESLDEYMEKPPSAAEINNGNFPWLRCEEEGSQIEIYAGITFFDFVQLIQQGNGQVYIKLEKLAS